MKKYSCKINFLRVFSLALTLSLLAKTNAYSQSEKAYVLTDEDVVVYEGMIESCYYDFSISDIIIPEKLDGQIVIGISGSWNTSAFGKKGITSVQLPKTLVYIGDNAFAANEIEKINLHEGIIEIGEAAFAKNKLTKVNIPISVDTVAAYAFALNSISEVVFSENTKISGIAFIKNRINRVNKKSSSGLFYKTSQNSKSNKTTIIGYGGASTEIDFIPQTVDTIAYRAFFGSELTSIKLPNSIVYIGEEAFSGNELTELSIPESVKEIEAYAFSSNKIEKLELAKGIKIIRRSAFRKNKIHTLILPSSLESIGNSAFEKNELTNLTLSEGIREIKSDVFRYNNLTSVKLPSSIRKFHVDAFSDNNITPLTLPIPNSENFVEWRNEHGKIKQSGDLAIEADDWYRAYYRHTLTKDDVSFEKGEIERFYNRNNERHIVIPDSINGQEVLVIGYNAFKSGGLYTVILPSTLQKIEEDGFRANQFKEIKFPKSLKYIGRAAFFDGAIESFTLTKFDDPDFVGWYFKVNSRMLKYDEREVTEMNNRSLEAMFIHTLNSNDVEIKDGVIEKYTGKEEFIKIPGEINGQAITKINDGAFKSSNLKYVILPNSIIHIGESAFSYNDLDSIVIPSNVNFIGAYAFYENNIKKVIIQPKSKLQFIGYSAFCGNEIDGFVLPKSESNIIETWNSEKQRKITPGTEVKACYQYYEAKIKE